MFSGKKRIPICVEVGHVLEHTIVVPDVDADSDEATVNVQTAAIRFQYLDFDTLITFGMDNDLGSFKFSSIGEDGVIRNIGKIGHSKHDSFQKVGGGEKRIMFVTLASGANDSSSVLFLRNKGNKSHLGTRKVT